MRIAVAVLLLALEVLLLALTSCDPRPGGKATSAGQAAQPAIPATAQEEYPWPECPVIVAWLKKNLADPEGFEVVEWTRRTDNPAYDRVNVVVLYRAKTKFGGKALFSRGFGVRKGTVIEADAPSERR